MSLKEVFYLLIVMALQAVILGGFIIACMHIYHKYVKKDN